jgi:hypothetical protein
MRGSGAVRESDAGDEAGVIGSKGADAMANCAFGVVAVQDWQSQPKSPAASVAAAVTVGRSEFAAAEGADERCMPTISPRVAHAMLTPSRENSDPYAEQPRHHTVISAVQRAMKRARRERERGIVRER